MARISPDGKKVALVLGNALPRSDPLPDIYLFDLETENLTQLTFDLEVDDDPVWSHDGRRIFFRSYRDGGDAGIYSIPTEGGAAELIGRSAKNRNPLPWSVSPDDKTVLAVDAPSLEDLDIATLQIGVDDELKPLIDNDGWINEPMLSPNGEWMVYYSLDRPGAGDPTAPEINIRPYPEVKQQRRPVARGVGPVFSADGSKIFFYDGGGLSAVPVDYAPFRVGMPKMLFRGQYWYGSSGPSTGGRAWDVDPTQERFLMITMPRNAQTAAGDAAGGDDAPRIDVVLNWLDELKERVPLP